MKNQIDRLTYFVTILSLTTAFTVIALLWRILANLQIINQMLAV